MDESEFSRLYSDAVKCYDERNYKDALTKTNALLDINKNCYPCRSLKASILIESWDGSEETQHEIREAISHLDLAIKYDTDNKNMRDYLGNKGNALVALAEMWLKKTGINFKLNADIIDTLMKAKDCYQGSLEIDENQPNHWINKGNVLDYLGRHLGAIECYDMAILKDHKYYNAWGNRGITCWKLSGFLTNENDKESLFYHSMVYLGIELTLYPDFEIDEIKKNQIYDFIKSNKIEINVDTILKDMLPKKIVLLDNEFNLFEHFDNSFEQFYNDFCEREAFFLNTHFDCNHCGCSRLDLLNISIFSKTGDYKTPYNFMKRFYNILDEYRSARFLLALAQYRCKDFIFLDKPRYEPDYSLNYTCNVELLKDAFIKIMNICDKIAFFLVDYEKLTRKDGKILDDSDISFWNPNSIFTQTDILEKNEFHKDLVAIDTIRLDLEKGEFKNLKNIRHTLVHRYYILHDIVDTSQLTYPYDTEQEPLEDIQYHEDVNNFYMMAKNSLRLIRNMLFSLSFFVDYKEKQKTAGVNGPIPHLSWGRSAEVDSDEL